MTRASAQGALRYNRVATMIHNISPSVPKHEVLSLIGTLDLRFTKGDLLALPTKQGADPGVLATPLFGVVSALKL